MNYYELVIADDDRWCLAVAGESMPLDIRACTRVEIPTSIRFRVYEPGAQVDFDHTGWGAIPVISRRMADCLESLAPEDIQRIPAVIEGQPDAEREVLNVLACPDCINHERSEITYYPPNHPEKPGKPRGVLSLRIDPNRVGAHNVFRPKDWKTALIVSEQVKSLLEVVGITGAQFWPVTE